MGSQQAGFYVEYILGMIASTTNDTVIETKRVDGVVFAGGLDEKVEAEGLDKVAVWFGNRLDVVAQLAEMWASSWLSHGERDHSGQTPTPERRFDTFEHSATLFHILAAKAAPAGRLPITQCPAEYVGQEPVADMTLRPRATNPGHTYVEVEL
ncbi:hypothetical protein GSI_11637 [Ganoderma sinense ZZ0214-1]|uniref:Uncharacterized protein n=1 Tax=Ganoderma sinense ZZ0214-1 TaxID=1077348 RepID=A0A2G8RWM1_9APHY|nr:hypothetical protein GSI_11637 [Ganoderma sinense ZZ0214-1]